MSLLQMSLSGGVMILAIIIIRALTINKLPKKVFLILWGIALLRLVLPFSFSSAFSIYSLIPQSSFTSEFMTKLPAGNLSSSNLNEQPKEILAAPAAIQTDEWADQPKDLKTDVPSENSVSPSLWTFIWITGMILLAGFFVLTYFKCHKEFQMSLPVDNEPSRKWLTAHQLRRPVSIRQSGCISAPLTYGIFRPVILMPGNTDWKDEKTLPYVLEHEFVHIERLDMITKLIFTAVLCIHWFNPMVYAMYILVNRDLELSCDETVIRRFGEDKKSAYAKALISMEERKSGMIPLYNSFSKNAIEERITAAMKIRKRSIFTLLIAIVLIIGIILGFATSRPSASKKDYLTTIPGDEFSREESQELFALWFEDYESMTVTEFREKALSLIDTPEYRALVERFSQNEIVFEIEDNKEGEALSEFFDYFFQVFEPLTAENWQVRYFNDFVYSASSPSDPSSDTASLEYTLCMKILNSDALTTAEYDNARRQVHDILRSFLQEKTVLQLIDEQYMSEAIQAEIDQIAIQIGSDKLELSIDYFYTPISEQTLVEYYNTQYKEEWNSLLSPYAALGLTWEFENEEIKMYFQGHEVKGIYDAKKGTWITDHAGNSTFASDAVELYAEYENETLTGLRLASKSEQEEWNSIRNSDMNTDEKEARQYPFGTKADYESLLALMTPDYQSMSVSNFNTALLDWCNEDYERMERIFEDVYNDEYAVTLSENEKTFVTLTAALSRCENATIVEATLAGTPSHNITYGSKLSQSHYKCSKDNHAFVNLWYQFSYQITDENKLSVAERDQCIGGLMDSVQTFFSETNISDFASMSQSVVTTKLQEYAAKYSNELVIIEINAVQIDYNEN